MRGTMLYEGSIAELLFVIPIIIMVVVWLLFGMGFWNMFWLVLVTIWLVFWF